MGPADSRDAAIEEARENFERKRSRLNAARIAYVHGEELDGTKVTYDKLKEVAQETISANYELQRRRYGKVRLKLSVAKLLRRGW